MNEKIEFYKSVFTISELPKLGYPEIILCGRSNVGKSSFINSFFLNKSLAKTSSTPGKTRSLNFYLVNKNTFIVDLPGFGYAKVSKKERDYWEKIMDDYFQISRNILSAFHLIDSRHKATDLDLQLNKFLRENNIPYIILLTKADKLNQSEKALIVRRINEQFPDLIQEKNLFLYSSIDGTGKNKVVKIFNELIRR